MHKLIQGAVQNSTIVTTPNNKCTVNIDVDSKLKHQCHNLLYNPVFLADKSNKGYIINKTGLHNFAAEINP